MKLAFTRFVQQFYPRACWQIPYVAPNNVTFMLRLYVAFVWPGLTNTGSTMLRWTFAIVWPGLYITGSSTVFHQFDFFTEKMVAVELAFIKPFYFLIHILFRHDFKGVFRGGRRVTQAEGEKIAWVYKQNFTLWVTLQPGTTWCAVTLKGSVNN